MTDRLTKRQHDCFLRLLDMALEEDLGSGDVTCLLLPKAVQTTAMFIAREDMILAGECLLDDIASRYSPEIRTEHIAADGQRLASGQAIARWSGPADAIMSAERVALNFLQRLSGIATITAEYVRQVQGTRAKIYDTRKTTPGWRELEKYAVRTGGGCNHRMGLHDAVLVKDNHLAALARAGRITPLAEMAPMLDELRKKLPAGGFVEVEVDTLEQLADALRLPVDIILLDNMPPAVIRKAIEMRRSAGVEGKIEYEASGGITQKNLGEVAKTGVERISVGALTHSVQCVDIGLDSDLD
ncbi:MAG TPA: carboxylating nicotinate-nucleotide diphosphorylase [Phycisphaerae bacterium]|nr:carboxylating nicotinate-nucleotide diphosphorylase [Phycisphaerae bacterium]HPS52255.1 carboxylating nicotinate-nucleotide diphosphorylase [Phycisphaerae bacterium]